MKARDKAAVGPTLNEILRADGVDGDALTLATREYYDRRRYGEFLVSKGLITEAKLAIALSKQAADKGRYEEAWRYAVDANHMLNEREEEHLDVLHKVFRSLVTAKKGG